MVATFFCVIFLCWDLLYFYIFTAHIPSFFVAVHAPSFTISSCVIVEQVLDIIISLQGLELDISVQQDIALVSSCRVSLISYFCTLLCVFTYLFLCVYMRRCEWFCTMVFPLLALTFRHPKFLFVCLQWLLCWIHCHASDCIVWIFILFSSDLTLFNVKILGVRCFCFAGKSRKRFSSLNLLMFYHVFFFLIKTFSSVKNIGITHQFWYYTPIFQF